MSTGRKSVGQLKEGIVPGSEKKTGVFCGSLAHEKKNLGWFENMKMDIIRESFSAWILRQSRAVGGRERSEVCLSGGLVTSLKPVTATNASFVLPSLSLTD